MAHLNPRLLTNSELRRHEDCAAENAKLADCWSGDQVVILTIDCSYGYKYSGYTVMPSMSVDIMTPAEKPLWSSPTSSQRLTRQHCKRTIRLLEQTKVNKRLRPRPFYMKVDAHEIFETYNNDAAKEIFDVLATEYATMCILTHDVRDSMKALELFDVKLPSKAVFVDLIKVLEHQTRDEGIPEELSNYTDENIAVRYGRYDRKTGPSGGQLGLPYIRLLELVGPAAESHRKDFKKAAREDVALKRIVGRMRKG